MGNFIQIDPRMFDRGPRTSMLVGQAIGNTAQKAGDLFLQGKVQNMLARGQQRESAKGIASLYPREYQKQVEDGMGTQNQKKTGETRPYQEVAAAWMALRNQKFRLPSCATTHPANSGKSPAGGADGAHHLSGAIFTG